MAIGIPGSVPPSLSGFLYERDTYMGDKTKIKALRNQAKNLDHTAKSNPTLSKKEKALARKAAEERRAMADKLEAQTTDSNQ